LALLVYSAAWPPAARIPDEDQNGQIVNFISENLPEDGESFDEVWWGYHLVGSAARVIRIR
jgi:hypothetical protein